ncbi:MAG: Rrf2 family transcriptional regulator [Phycisphaerae bacterium]|nr:Rrf2 family transcriptional regulator [Phycisphaerae bacterium]
MKLSLAAELAVRGALVLAQQHGKGPITLAEVCELRDMSREYLAKVFGLLSRAELVTPIRGKNGGYVLARDPKDISLMDIFEAVEGPQYLNFCVHDPPQCDQVETCKVHRMWVDLQEIFEERLRSTTLADCV